MRKLEEEYKELQFHENYFKDINNAFSQNLQFNEDKQITGIELPLNIGQKEEKLLLTYLWKIQSNRNFILQYYSEVEEKIELLRTEIRKEIEE